MISFAAICPHPPLLIPEIGNFYAGKLEDTRASYKTLSASFNKNKPDSIFLISPHSYSEQKKFTISNAQNLKGDFKSFGTDKLKQSYTNDIFITNEIKNHLKQNNQPFKLYSHTEDTVILDHGVLVPLHFLKSKHTEPTLTLCGYSGHSLTKHYEFGQYLGDVLTNSEKNIALIASGDLSHRLTKNAPAGYNPKAYKFDEKIITLLQNKDIDELLALEYSEIEEAGECGLRSIIILLGILDSYNYEIDILSYEGPFGVGYLIANIIFL